MNMSLFLVLNICNTISSFSLSVIAPFFPTYAYSLGISSEMVGLIFAVQPLGAVISSLKVGATLTKDNRMKFMEWGMFLQATCISLFVFAHILNEYYSVIILTLLARVCNGAGYSMFVTAFYSMIPTMYPQTVESKIAMAETASSLGFIIAPLLGSLLYSIGGFDLPFIVFSILSLFSGVYIHRLKEKPIQPEEIELTLVSDTQQIQLSTVQQVTYWHAIKHYELALNQHTVIPYRIFPDNKDECNNIGSGLFSAAMSLGEFIGPLFAGWLREYHDYDRISSIIGIMMICISISYIPFLLRHYAI